VVVVLKWVYLAAALLAAAAGVLVTASLFMASPPAPSPKFLGISLVASGAFGLTAVVLFGIQRHVTAVAAAVRGPGCASAPALAAHVRRLVAHLLAAGACVCVLLALLSFGIVGRIAQGLAVFG
jgi:hypothetical protein